MRREMAKLLIISGIILVVAGILIYFGKNIPFLGRLPGDIHIKKENFSFHFPIATSIILSILITLILYLIGKFK